MLNTIKAKVSRGSIHHQVTQRVMQNYITKSAVQYGFTCITTPFITLPKSYNCPNPRTSFQFSVFSFQFLLHLAPSSFSPANKHSRCLYGMAHISEIVRTGSINGTFSTYVNSDRSRFTGSPTFWRAGACGHGGYSSAFCYPCVWQLTSIIVALPLFSGRFTGSCRECTL